MPVFTLSNYRALTAGELASSPPVPQLKNLFQPSSVSFPFQWLNRDQEAVRYAEAQLAEESRVSRRAVHVYYFRLLAALPRRRWVESLKRHTIRYFYSWRNKLVSVSFWNCPKRTFCLSEIPKCYFLNVLYKPVSVLYFMYAGFMATYANNHQPLFKSNPSVERLEGFCVTVATKK